MKEINTQEEINKILERPVNGNFQDTQFNCPFEIKNRYFLDSNESNFRGCIFKKGADFKNIVFNVETSFENAVFEAKVYFENAAFRNNVRFIETKFQEEVIFENTHFDKLVDFSSATFHKKQLFFKTDFKDTAVFEKAIFKEDVLFTYSLLGRNAIFRSAQFEKGLDLSSVSNIEGNINFFDLKLNFNKSQESEIPLKNRRETFRIIKNQLIKQNDKIEALYYHGLEMKAYKAELKSNIKYSESFLLWLNNSNNYGQNWVKPIILMLFLNLVFPISIIYAQFNSIYDCKPFWSLYWQLLSPTIQVRDLFQRGITIEPATHIAFFFSRLFLAYFIYQTISAFRKHSK